MIDGLQGAVPSMKKKRLDSLRIERFRQIRELSIPELGHVNLVVGGNNSGKSTLLDALRFYAAKAAPSLLEDLLHEHGEIQSLNPLEGLIPSQALRSLFHGRKFPTRDGEAIYVGSTDEAQFVRLEHIYQILDEFIDKDDEGNESTRRRFKRAFKIGDEDSLAAADVVDFVSIEGGAREVHRIRLADLFAEDGRGARYEGRVDKVPCVLVPPDVPGYQGLAEIWDEIVLTDGENIALSSLRMIEPQTQGLAFTKARVANSDRASERMRVARIRLAGTDGPLPLRAMGDGMARVLQLILSALRAGDGLLLVDEFENGLHYSVQAKVWEMLFSLAQTKGLQIFATTHSNDCVRAFSQVALANTEVDGKLLKLERMPDDGRTVVATLGEDDLSNLLDAGIDVRS